METDYQTLRILIADDSKEFSESLREYLELRRGLHVVGNACNGLEAIVLANSLEPNVILMDINMPEMNGIDAARQIKRGHPETKIYFVTVHTENTFKALAKLIPAEGFISKNCLEEGVDETLENYNSNLLSA